MSKTAKLESGLPYSVWLKINWRARPALSFIEGCHKKYARVAHFKMFSRNCFLPDGDCSVCSAYNVDFDNCNQDDDLVGTGHGDDDSYSDADPGL